MKSFELLLSNIDFIEVSGDAEIEVSSICYDSRKVKEGSLFIAVRGYVTDGHNFIKDALEKGAVAFIVEEIPEYASEYSDVAFVKVADSRLAMAELSHAWYDYPAEELKLIGVTGTNGKTTVTYLIYDILKQQGIKAGVIGTTGIIIGEENQEATHTTPESLELAETIALMRDSGVKYVVMEVSSHSLIQKRVKSLNFDAAVFTNITHEHLDFHGTMDNYAKAKKMLFDSLDQEAVAIVNSDSGYSNFMVETCNAPKYTLSAEKETDFRISDVELGLEKTSYDLIWYKNQDQQIYNIETLLPGDFNVHNTAIAASICLLMGIEPDAVVDGIEKCKGAPGRMDRIKLKNGAVGIVDYAHTPDALEKALSSLVSIKEFELYSNSEIICVFGCGGDRDAAKRPEMGKIAADLADKIIITNDNPRTEDDDKIIEDIIKGIPEDTKKEIKIIKDRITAIEEAVSISKKNDIILVAGKGHETYQIIGTEKHHFDDLEILKKA